MEYNYDKENISNNEVKKIILKLDDYNSIKITDMNLNEINEVNETYQTKVRVNLYGRTVKEGDYKVLYYNKCGDEIKVDNNVVVKVHGYFSFTFTPFQIESNTDKNITVHVNSNILGENEELNISIVKKYYETNVPLSQSPSLELPFAHL